MSTIGRSAGRAGWAGEPAVLAAVAGAVVPMGVLHLVGSTVVDPVGATISDHVAVPGGYGLLGVGALAVAGLLLAGGVRAAQLPRPGLLQRLLLALVAVLVIVLARAVQVAAGTAPVTLRAPGPGCGGAV